jgi:hypothetical protein
MTGLLHTQSIRISCTDTPQACEWDIHLCIHVHNNMHTHCYVRNWRQLHRTWAVRAHGASHAYAYGRLMHCASMTISIVACMQARGGVTVHCIFEGQHSLHI